MELSARTFRVLKMISYVLSSNLSFSEKESHLNYLLSKVFLKNLKTKLTRESPFIVSVIGADGVGKTTTAAKVKAEFEARGLRSAYVWSRCASPLLNALLKMSEATLKGSDSNGKNEKSEKSILEQRKTSLSRNSVIRKILVSAILLDYGLSTRLKFLSFASLKTHLTH